MARKKKDPFAEEIEYEIVSKSEMKRDMIELQELGERIVALPRKKAMELPISEMMKAAIREADRVGKNEAMRRHMQYIGRLIRSEDIDAVREALDLLDPSSEAYGRVTGQQEQWRTRLIKDPAALNEFIEQFPTVDRQHLRVLIRNATKEMSSEPPKPGSNYKNLFKTIKEQYNQKEDD
jgi:ribosome-associated protein